MKTRILALDTSGAYCAAAVLTDGNVVATRHEEMAKGQAERLFPMLEEALQEARLDYADLDRLAVGVGPGNFTGIRIAVSAARGLALSLNIPAVGVSLFDALAEGAPDAPLLLSLRAARARYYFQIRSGATAGDISTAMLDNLPNVAAGTLCVGVDSAEIAGTLGLEHAPAAFAPAAAIAQVAARHTGPMSAPTPLYVRAADAMPSSDPPPVILP